VEERFIKKLIETSNDNSYMIILHFIRLFVKTMKCTVETCERNVFVISYASQHYC